MSTKKKKLSKYEKFLAKNKRLGKDEKKKEEPKDDEYSEWVNILSEAKRINKTLSTQHLLEYFALLIQSYCNDAISKLRIMRFTPKVNLKGYKQFKFSNHSSFLPVLYPKLKNSSNQVLPEDVQRSRYILSSLPHFHADKGNMFDLQLLSSSDLQWRSYEEIDSYWKDNIALFALPNDKVQILCNDATVIEKQKVSTTDPMDIAKGDTPYDYIEMHQTSKKLIFSDIEQEAKDLDDNDYNNKHNKYRAENIPDARRGISTENPMYCWQQSTNGEVYMIVKGQHFIKLYTVQYNIDTKRFECDLIRKIDWKEVNPQVNVEVNQQISSHMMGFNTFQARRVLPTVICPMCLLPVQESYINQHIDSGCINYIAYGQVPVRKEVFNIRGKLCGYYYMKKWDALFFALNPESSIIMIRFNYKNDKPLIVKYTYDDSHLYAGRNKYYSCLYFVKELNRLLIIWQDNMYEFNAKTLYDCATSTKYNGKLKEYKNLYLFTCSSRRVGHDDIFERKHEKIWNAEHEGYYKMISDYNQKCVLCISESNQHWGRRFKYIVTKYPINHESIKIKQPIYPNKSDKSSQFRPNVNVNRVNWL